MSVFTTFKKEMTWGGKTLSFETGKIGRQADGSVIVRYGDTMVHATVCAAKTKPETFEDFIPLTVNYQEKTYSAGQIPGGFFKREGKPSEHEILVSRLIDRPIRPLFVKGFNNETQVVCTLISYDKKTQADIVAMIAASAAITISGLPFLGPIAGARVGYIDGQYVLNPDLQQMKNTDLDLVVAGTKEGVLMVESEAQELSEEVMLGAVEFGHESLKPVIDLIIALAEECAKDPWEVQKEPAEYEAVRTEIKEKLGAKIADAYKIHNKLERQTTLDAIREEAKALFEGKEVELSIYEKVFHEIEYRTVRDSILAGNPRIDGRDTKTVRVIETEVGLLPKAHGSALFTRGETQALVSLTLGGGKDALPIESLDGDSERDFILNYNFPGFSVGEAKGLKAPGRRELGHGNLAWRAIHPMIPTRSEFDYVIRVCSDILESNGSSSMATTCGATLALMDGGVPMKRPVAGIAMGLIKEGKDYAILTDILGDEDHLGDMDFKVTGTNKGITALQMDIKITSITFEIMEHALAQAKDGRMHILGKIEKAIKAPRKSVSEYAPQSYAMKINPDKVREVIGKGGSVIQALTRETNTQIELEDDGSIKIMAVSKEDAENAIARIKEIVAEPEVGEIYAGVVSGIKDFGVFVKILKNFEALVHISEITGERLNKIEDAKLKEGDKVFVKYIGTDKRGKTRLSMVGIDQKTGKEIKK